MICVGVFGGVVVAGFGVSELRELGLIECKFVDDKLEYTATPCICGLHKH